MLQQTRPEALSDEDFAQAVKRLIEDARRNITENYQPEREKAWRLVKGDNSDDAKTDEKTAGETYTTDAADTLNSLMPDLMEMFMGGESAVEYVATSSDPRAIAMAKAKTKQINEIIWEDSDGYRAIYDSAYNAAVTGLGPLKVFMKRRELMTRVSMPVDQASLYAIQQNSRTVLDNYDEQTGEASWREYHSVEWPDIEAVPVENFFFTEARDLELTSCHCEYMRVTKGALVGMGFKVPDIEAADPTASSDLTTSETQERTGRTDWTPDDYGFWASKEVDAYNAYCRIDRDGDGLPELWHVVALGDGSKILQDEVVEESEYIAPTLDRRPHEIHGHGIIERVADVQGWRSRLMEALLDNAEGVNTGFWEAAPNSAAAALSLADLKRNKIIIAQPGTLAYNSVASQAAALIPVLEYADKEKASKSGINDAVNGLDPDALQNTTATAIQGTLGASQRKMELYARNYAETGVKPLFRRLLRITTPRPPQQPGQVNDPRQVDPMLKMRVNVGLGTTRIRERTALLMQVIADQNNLMMQEGGKSHLTDWTMMANAREDALGPYANLDVTRYYKSAQQIQAEAQQPQPPQQPDPKQVADQQKFQLGMAQLQEKAANNQQKLQLDAWKAQTDAALKRLELNMEAILEPMKIKSKMQTGDGNLKRPT